MTQHKDTTLNEILADFSDGIAAEEAWIDARQALLQWRDRAVVEELETIYHKHGRTYKQTVVDGSGNVYSKERHRYISSYEVQERILQLKEQLKETPNED